ncbi:YggT family protein [Desulfosporosinus sp. PR]|uniref:YggT family protein n=1 Tax=Candidatus Desulfosporosinus nitrosoreducens TaxID=3401928 RepID=UPI0027ED8FE0|nr:YggT family protein [Desulfosporosinus sp. PR]MDQ7093289.1 YggT family protein [Desulfosporosinus sp. PR]
MDEITAKKPGSEHLKAKQIVYYVLGVIEVLFAFRLVFKLLGANPQSPFVSLIYSITQVFLAPFSGIFPSAVTKGLETQSVLEPSTIIAMIVYAILAWGVIKLIEINRTPRHTETH